MLNLFFPDVMHKLPRNFYNRNTLDVAIDLIGCELISHAGDIKTGGIIVETEAYIGSDDPACHAFRGQTRTNRIMFGPPGFLYVYFTYGNHFMINFVTQAEGYPAAALIRGIEPVYNIDIMAERRGTDDLVNISNGPGKLTKALGVTGRDYGADLCGSQIYVTGPSPRRIRIMASPRIGIGSRGAEKLWRFYEKNSPFVSPGTKSIRESSVELSLARERDFLPG